MVEEIKIPKTRKEAFKVLELSESASEEEIKKAYKKCALKWHPDKWSGKSKKEQKKATENFKAVNAANGILKNEISEEFISKQTNDDWADELVKKFEEHASDLRKERHGSHLSKEEIDLFDALSAKDLEKTKCLLEKIKNINVQSKILDTEIYKAPLHYIVQNACEEPHNDWKTLLEEVLSKHSSSSLTAAHARNTITCSKSNIIDVNIKYNYVGTPLHIACKLGCPDVVSVLLEYGADPNVESTCDTPVNYALKQSRNDIVEMIFTHVGEKISSKNVEDVFEEGVREKKIMLLELATKFKDKISSGTLSRIFSQIGYNEDPNNNNDVYENVKLVLQYGPVSKINEGSIQTVFISAATTGNKEVLNLFLNYRINIPKRLIENSILSSDVELTMKLFLQNKFLLSKSCPQQPVITNGNSQSIAN